jgi:hypothetical protein
MYLKNLKYRVDKMGEEKLSWMTRNYNERRSRAICAPTLLDIQEIQDSNLGPETGYPDWGFRSFSSDPPGKFRDTTLPLQLIIY